MYYAGISSNIMSLAGIAIAIGVLVDAGIVVTENAFRYVEQRGVDPRDRRRVWDTVLESTRLVGRPVFFSMAIILLAFVPVFALTGQEGKLFHPLAFTKTFAVLAATVISVTRSFPCCARSSSAADSIHKTPTRSCACCGASTSLSSKAHCRIVC
jgi:Cu(I)/Ag(I) efflux system membrane protein CusA/SilA